jgi:FMN phosphatase YigB (HAD superfamily)
MENIKALFIDCDGVLYNDAENADDNIVNISLGKTLAPYGISMDEFNQTRAALKEEGIRGLFNSVLDLCNRYHIKFDDFAVKMVNNTDYSQIPNDPEMLELLKKVATCVPVYIVTNNTAPHLIKIFDLLRGKTSPQSPQEELGIHLISIEDTLAFDRECQRTIFHPKQMKDQFKKLCAQVDLLPEQVALIDDTERIRKKAEKQGVVPIATEGPQETKEILRRIIHEKSKPERAVFIREARCCAGR